VSLLDKLKKNSTVKMTSILSESKVLQNREFVTTRVPAINLALSGSFNGGLSSGAITIAGESKSFKTGIALVLAAAYQQKYPDSAVLFYDSEFGSPDDYFKTTGVDVDRVIHTPISNIEDLKFDLMKQLDGMERGDKVFILVDSIGNLASKKEVEDALDGKSVADMSRAKQMKSFFRMVTPVLTLKDLPMVVINHTYKCGTADMKVIGADGIIALPDIHTGNMVMTTQGMQPVLSTVVYENAPVTDIELEDGTVLSFTEGHRFMVDGVWKYVQDIEPGDEIELH
jgi:RecA/RadA recombinase